MLVPANTFAEMYNKAKDELRDYTQQRDMFEQMMAKAAEAMAELKPLAEWQEDGYYPSAEPYTDVYGDLIVPPPGYVPASAPEPTNG